MATYKVLKDFSQYEISENGIIRKIVSKAIIKQRKHPREGLMMCDLYDNDLIARTAYPHKEVAKTFIPTRRKGRLLVIHKNGNKKDNKIQNLQWISMGDFQKLQVERGTREQLGNPELYKHSKFWKAKNKKQKTQVVLVKKAGKKANEIEKIVTSLKNAKTSKVKSKNVKQTSSNKIQNKLTKVKSKPTNKKKNNPPKGKKIVKVAKPALKIQKAVKAKPVVKSKRLVKKAVLKVEKKISKPIAKVSKTISSIKSKKPIAKVSTIAKKNVSAPIVSIKSKPAIEEVKPKIKLKRNRIKAKKVFSVKN
jgi:hypothetical protein